jgi:NAD(P)-dependent dehydrogenase (short-subunit alcohol dehydrogenase family)
MREDGPFRVAIVGASGDIGAATAHAFAESDRGARIALMARSKDVLESLAEDLDGPYDATVRKLDVSKQGGPEKAIDKVAEDLGGLDVVVVNVAAAGFGPFEEIPDKDFRRTVDVTLLGAIACVRGALPHLRRSGGNAVITGSLVADLPMPYFTAYVTAKAGLAAFAETLRAELRDEGADVGISVVEPGPVKTGLWRKAKAPGGEAPPVPIGSVDAKRVAKQIIRRASKPKSRVGVGPFAAVRAVARIFPGVRDRLLPLGGRYLQRESSPPEDGEGEALWQSSEDARRK